LKRTHPPALELVPWILEGIGKIVSYWAHDEWRLTRIADTVVWDYGPRRADGDSMEEPTLL
jgi:hypothetical protein